MAREYSGWSATMIENVLVVYVNSKQPMKQNLGLTTLASQKLPSCHQASCPESFHPVDGQAAMQRMFCCRHHWVRVGSTIGLTTLYSTGSGEVRTPALYVLTDHCSWSLYTWTCICWVL